MSDSSTPLRWILVLGMHRSGTSAMTRALLSMDVSLGGDLMEPVEGVNPKGFWEDMDIYRLDDAMLHSLGTDWYHSTPISEAGIRELLSQSFAEQAKAILQSKKEAGRPFACKDPRLCRLLPFWQEILAQMEGATGYVLALRNPVSIADSLQKRDGLDRTQSYLLWAAHTLPSLMRTEGAPRVLVEYDLLLEDPRGQVQRMAQALGLSVNTEELQRYADEFLEKGLRHSRYTLKDLAQDETCPAWIASLYRTLRQVARDAKALDDPTLQQRLEGARKQLLGLSTITSAMDHMTNAMNFSGPSDRAAEMIVSNEMAELLEAKIYVSERINGNPQPFNEIRGRAMIYRLDSSRQIVKIAFPSDLYPLVCLRLDIANAPASITLHSLSLHNANGAEIWHWNGDCAAFANLRSVLCSSGADGVVLLCVNNDPQFDLVIPQSGLSKVQENAYLQLDLTPQPLLDHLPAVLRRVEQETGDLRQQLESQRAQAQQREHQLREQAARELGSVKAKAAIQIEQLQGQIVSLQDELLERERAFSQQWTVWRAEEQQRHTEFQQVHAAQEEQRQQEIKDLRQQLESQRAQTQQREDLLREQSEKQLESVKAQAATQAEQLQREVMALQHELLERERAFTQQWTTWQAEGQQRISDVQETYIVRENQLREDARVQIDGLRESLHHYGVCNQVIAQRLASLQSTLWWRLSMPWRRASNWPEMAGSILPPVQADRPQQQPAVSAPTSGASDTVPEK